MEKTRKNQVMDEPEVDFQIRQTQVEPFSNSIHKWSNGQCVVAVQSFSAFNPSFNLSPCRAKLERNGFQIPVGDMETPLQEALEVPAVKRFMVFNSSLFHFIMAPVLYVVLWCAMFSTLDLFLTVTDYWVLCLSVSLITIFLTTVIIFTLHRGNEEITINVDVRLIRVNEKLMKHNLLVGVADWVKNCSGNMQLYFVYWDMSGCLRTLTETLEDQCFISDIQKKLKGRMSHLVLVAGVPVINPEAGGPDAEKDSDEKRPLLNNENASHSPSSKRADTPKVTTNYSLIPHVDLPAQDKAYQLLMTYSAVYVKLLMSEKLTGPSQHHLQAQRNHCTRAPLCLCQYIKNKILQ